MKNACLIVHGLTGSPATVEVLKDAFMAAGFATATPCLAGHGKDVAELASVGWRDWYQTVRNSYAILRKEAESVFYVGISLGALLGLKLAIDEGFGVRALCLISTPLKLRPLDKLAEVAVRNSPLKLVVKKVSKNFKNCVADPAGLELYKKFSLHHIPATSVFELADLQSEVAASISNIVQPTMILHSAKDRVAPPSNVKLIEDGVSSAVVEKAIFHNSLHVLTMDVEKEQVAKTAVDFCSRFS